MKTNMSKVQNHTFGIFSDYSPQFTKGEQMKTNKHGIRKVSKDEGYFIDGTWSTQVLNNRVLNKVVHYAFAKEYEFIIDRLPNSNDGIIQFKELSKQQIRDIKGIIYNESNNL